MYEPLANHFEPVNSANDRQELNNQTSYQEPQMIACGRSVDLLQSYSWGAYDDSYTGYFWDR
jgi:hypothetical protein